MTVFVIVVMDQMKRDPTHDVMIHAMRLFPRKILKTKEYKMSFK
jgi:hypothetical protein